MQTINRPVLRAADFDSIRHWLYETAGIDLREGKEALVEARLQRCLRAGGHTSYRSLIEQMKRDPAGELLTDVLDALTTNHTGFLRERRHFDFLTDRIVPEVASNGPLRIWSAACSTGQEPYSIACALLGKSTPACAAYPQILATDLSTRVLATARAGKYTQEQCRDIPPDWRQRFFTAPGNGESVYTVSREVSQLIQFRRLNLIEPINGIGPFHVIFCRNVMLYFDRATQLRLVDRLVGCLSPKGYLFTGHSESLPSLPPNLKHIQPAVYQKGG